MATHELPEWEAPPKSTRKSNIWRKSNPFLLTPTIDRAHSYFSRKLSRKTSPLATPASDKEVGETPAETATTANEISPGPRWCGFPRRICIFILISLIVLIALIVGLAVGLGHKSHSQQAQNLPLPSNTGIFTGDLTYYDPGYPGYGACGYQNTSQEAICAISHIVWDADLVGLTDGNDNPLCGKKIRITRFDESVGANRSVDVEVVDRCVGCAANDLDLSTAMFDSLAAHALGRVVGSWAWLP